MTYARIVNNAIDTLGRLPQSARRLDTDEWVMGLDTASPELVAACGWYEVVDTARPADTATTTHDRSVELVNGTPTVVWTERPKTQAELDAEAESVERNDADLRLRQSYNALRNWADDAAVVAAQGTNVTQAQHKALFDRFGKLCDGLADLLVSLAKR